MVISFLTLLQLEVWSSCGEGSSLSQLPWQFVRNQEVSGKDFVHPAKLTKPYLCYSSESEGSEEEGLEQSSDTAPCCPVFTQHPVHTVSAENMRRHFICEIQNYEQDFLSKWLNGINYILVNIIKLQKYEQQVLRLKLFWTVSDRRVVYKVWGVGPYVPSQHHKPPLAPSVSTVLNLKNVSFQNLSLEAGLPSLEQHLGCSADGAVWILLPRPLRHPNGTGMREFL